MENDGYRFLSVPVHNASDYVMDKEKSIEEIATYFLMRVMKMFKYEGLPEEIPVDCLSKMLLTNGYGFFTKYKSTNSLGEQKDQYYFFKGRMGDVIDAYYRPTKIIVANPGANCYETFDLAKQKGGTYYGEKGVIIRNDTLYHGLMPLILRYSYLLAENLITMRTADVFLRIIALISAQDDKTYVSAGEFIKAIENGKMMAVAEGKFFEGVKMQSPPSNNGSYLTQFIEYQQYFLGSFFNEIGLNANFNMKRESIAKSESSLNEDSMLPLCQNMLMCRQEDFNVVNEMFGLNIKVSFDSAWLQNAIEIALELEQLKSANSLGMGGMFNDKATNQDQGTESTNSEDGSGDAGGGNGGSSEGSSGEAKEEGNKEENGDGVGADAGAGVGNNVGDANTEPEIVTDEMIAQAAGLSQQFEEEANELADEKEGEEENESTGEEL
ncbi:MAG: hypothetical protein J6Q75_00190 [Bacteroidaceae bacterium]|nr:hypothetical protein [Bacteroidaceae bacterium]